MKKSIILIIAGLIWLSQPVQAKDACQTVLCMAGMLQGAGVSNACGGAVADYFDIKRWRKGKFKPGRTADARGAFLNSCAAPGSASWKSRIQSQYGHMFGL